MGDKPLVLIMCGGQSLRLWPLSEYKSKNFLDIFGFSPLEFTIKRFLKITPAANIFLVANQRESEALVKLKIIKKENIFFEPESKNTAAAILLVLSYLKKWAPPWKVLIVSPVDHLIKQEGEFYAALSSAINASGSGWICTLGIKPSQPTPNFGYIEVDSKIDEDVFKIKRFIEKPTRLQAQELIRRGNSFYNSGMFISSILTFDREYRKYYAHYNDFIRVFKKPSAELLKATQNLYKTLEDIPFDKAIMEHTRRARLIKGNFFWKDFGSWNAVYDVLAKDKNGNVKKGKAFISDGENNLIYLDNPKKKVLALGLKDIFFIDTDKYTFITHRYYLDNLKLALKEFKAKFK